MTPELVEGSLYSLSFDVRQWEGRLEEINHALDDQVMITGWWNYIPGLYLFRSTPNNVELMRRIRTFMGRRHCILLEIGRPDQIIGYLPAEAWGWFYGLDEEMLEKLQVRKRERLAAANRSRGSKALK